MALNFGEIEHPCTIVAIRLETKDFCDFLFNSILTGISLKFQTIVLKSWNFVVKIPKVGDS